MGVIDDEFILNTKIVSGDNALLELDLSKSKKVYIVTDHQHAKNRSMRYNNRTS